MRYTTEKDYYYARSVNTIFKQDVLKSNYYAKYRRYCKCGHSMTITEKKKMKLCSYCGRLVFANDEIEKEYNREIFKRKLRRKMNENR